MEAEKIISQFVEFLNKHPLVEKVNHPSVNPDSSQQELYKKYYYKDGDTVQKVNGFYEKCGYIIRPID